MSESAKPVGSIAWTDLTVADATGLKSFYESVTGWTSSGVEMGDYEDFCMNLPDSATTVAGICHARGVNADLPAQWLIYIVVANLKESIERCVSLGGKLLHRRDNPDGGGIAVIEDPAGAVAALYQLGDNANTKG